MSGLPEGRRGRLLALAISVLALGLLWLGGVGPLLDWQAEQSDHVAIRTRMLARMQALVDHLPDMQAAMAARKAGTPENGVLLQGQTDAVAAAELQQLLQRLVQDAGGRISSIEILTPEQVGVYRRIGLRVAFQATYAGNIGLLRSIAAARPGMLVDDLKLQAPAQRNPSMPMDVSFTLLAYRQGGAP